MSHKVFWLLTIGLALLICGASCSKAEAAKVSLAWEAVDFGPSGSDPLKSGYKLYVSYDNGETKTHFGGDLSAETLTFGPFEEVKPGKVCYYATSFNQFGESGYSVPACDYIATSAPPVPTGVMAIIERIVSWFKSVFMG